MTMIRYSYEFIIEEDLTTGLAIDDPFARRVCPVASEGGRHGIIMRRHHD